MYNSPLHIKEPLPHFLFDLCRRTHKGYVWIVHDAAVEHPPTHTQFCCLFPPRWLQIWVIKWRKASRWKSNHREIPCIAFSLQHTYSTWNGCKGRRRTELGSCFFTLTLQSYLRHWASSLSSVKINKLWPHSCRGLCWRPPPKVQHRVHLLCLPKRTAGWH